MTDDNSKAPLSGDSSNLIKTKLTIDLHPANDMIAPHEIEDLVRSIFAIRTYNVTWLKSYLELGTSKRHNIFNDVDVYHPANRKDMDGRVQELNWGAVADMMKDEVWDALGNLVESVEVLTEGKSPRGD